MLRYGLSDFVLRREGPDDKPFLSRNEHCKILPRIKRAYLPDVEDDRWLIDIELIGGIVYRGDACKDPFSGYYPQEMLDNTVLAIVSSRAATMP